MADEITLNVDNTLDEITLNVDNTLVTPGYVDSQDAQMLASANAYANGLKLETDAQIAKKQNAYQYELIETITLTQAVSAITRTQEPSGTAYKFRDVIIHGKVKSVTGSAALSSAMYQGDTLINSMGISGALSNTQIKYFIEKCKDENGLYETTASNTSFYDSSMTPSLTVPMIVPFNESVGISKIQLNIYGGDTFAVGSEFQIWGIRL